MKRNMLLPIAFFVLVGCSHSSTQAPIEDVNSIAIITPSSWKPEIQYQPIVTSTSEASSMVQTLPPPPMPSSQAKASVSVGQTGGQSAVVSMPTTTLMQPVQVVTSQQDMVIPRNEQTNVPDYSKIDKGFYKGETYQVRAGDTLFFIAYISGLDVKELAAMNGMSEPYTLAIGQVLKVGTPKQQLESPPPTPAPIPLEKAVQPHADGTITGSIKAEVGTSPSLVQGSIVAKPTQKTLEKTTSDISWIWPTNGQVIQNFSLNDGGNKGIDISGSRGQAVNAAADGRVVYAGNALRGYGNLIIIKHDETFLSAYAHNESISVKEQQEVRKGQQIARMGSSGTNKVKLHFEIRYKGKSVDPLTYLPNR